MSRRKGGVPGVSFFAFQDIITAVVGIFILITLLLVLELAERVSEASGGVETTDDIAQILSAIEVLREEVEQLRQEYQERSAQSNRTTTLNRFNAEEELTKLRDRVANEENRLRQLENNANSIEKSLAQAQQDQGQLQAVREELRKQEDMLEALVEEMRQTQNEINRVQAMDTEIFRDVMEDGRYLVLVTLGDGAIIIRDALAKKVSQLRGGNRVAQFEQWLSGSGGKSRHFMVFVKPDGALDFEEVKGLLADRSVTYGYTVVKQDHMATLAFETVGSN